MDLSVNTEIQTLSVPQAIITFFLANPAELDLKENYKGRL